MITTRDRTQIDNRHKIRDPIRIDPVTQQLDLKAVAVWSNTLVKTRIPQLFLTYEGLIGHVVQLQNELNRFKIDKLEGCNADRIDVLTLQMKFVREATKKSIEAARRCGFPLPNNLFLEFSFISDRLKI